MNDRRGFSLVEVLAVIAGCSVMLSLTASLMVRAMRSQAETRHFFEVENRALALADQFRRDVHRARAADVDAASLGERLLLRLELPDEQTVEYRRDADAVVRTARRPGRQPAREDYRLGGAVDIEVQSTDAPRQLVLTVASIPDPQPGDAAAGSQLASFRQMPFSLQTAAMVGRDWRFAASAGTDASAGEEAP